MKTSNKNKELRAELLSVQTQFDLAARDLEKCVKEKEVVKLSLSEKIRELEAKVVHLSETKAENIPEEVTLSSAIVNPSSLSLTTLSTWEKGSSLKEGTENPENDAENNTKQLKASRTEAISTSAKQTSSKFSRDPWKCELCDFTTKWGYTFEQVLHKKKHEDETNLC